MVLFRNARHSSSRLVRDGMHDGGARCSHLRPRRCFDGHCLRLSADPLQQARAGDDAQYCQCDCAYES